MAAAIGSRSPSSSAVPSAVTTNSGMKYPPSACSTPTTRPNGNAVTQTVVRAYDVR
ncbi:hypothetical protein OG763_06235 [Streptomyces sp. NBC_01230]|nr:hypothetical protein OG763_06235 [Streptomyces sp. NBC_01230]